MQFVTKMSEDSDEFLDSAPNHHQSRKEKEVLGFSIHGGERSRTTIRSSSVTSRSPARSPASSVAQNPYHRHLDHDGGSEAGDADSEGGSSINEFFEFDVYEREGFDKIMQTVACGGTHSTDHDYAQNICDYLEIFESLTPGRESVGYLICDQLTLERYGNRRFQNMSIGFLEVNELHVIVTDMHAELLALAPRASFAADRSLIRTFPHRDSADPSSSTTTSNNQVLEVTAALIRRHPALSLFVSRVNVNGNNGSSNTHT